MDSHLTDVERSVAGKDPRLIMEALERCRDEELVGLLDSKSRRAGDVAARLLVRREQVDMVVEALVQAKLRRAEGRVRATWVLHQFGKKCPGAPRAYLALLSDRSIYVLSNALFGLVFSRYVEALEPINSALRQASGQRRDLLATARQALLENNPRLYSPYYLDSNDVWDLHGL